MVSALKSVGAMLGAPAQGRAKSVEEILRPLARLDAHPRSLSAIYGTERLPFYTEGTQAGLNLRKPKMELTPMFHHIVERITLMKPTGWTLVGLRLLSCANPAEQKAIERNLNKVRAFVRRNYRKPEHAHTMVVQPPKKRKAPVLFHLFPEE